MFFNSVWVCEVGCMGASANAMFSRALKFRLGIHILDRAKVEIRVICTKELTLKRHFCSSRRAAWGIYPSEWFQSTQFCSHRVRSASCELNVSLSSLSGNLAKKLAPLHLSKHLPIHNALTTVTYGDDNFKASSATVFDACEDRRARGAWCLCPLRVYDLNQEFCLEYIIDYRWLD